MTKPDVVKAFNKLLRNQSWFCINKLCIEFGKRGKHKVALNCLNRDRNISFQTYNRAYYFDTYDQVTRFLEGK